MGGSQGARAINEIVLQCLPSLAGTNPDWQWLHLTGSADFDAIKAVYASFHFTASVRAFVSDMELVLGAATAAISRAGASSLAELAAMRLPAVLLPYPKATDNHQFFNAQAFQQAGAAYLLQQQTTTPAEVSRQLQRIMTESSDRHKMQQALAQWDAPAAADQIATAILKALGRDVQSVNAGANTKTQSSPNSGDLNRCSSQRTGRRPPPLRLGPKPGGVLWA
jgi:UDP-N-acetylglucosamine--N-acetylmuramyl-(pentapeptide) pyrophosphoryl-undecaprenol N-acetylglucosamine transferase